MSRAANVAIAKRILELYDKDEPEYGPESWVTSVDRFINKERFELERKKFFLERPQLIGYSADIPDPGSYYTTEIAGRPIILTRDKNGKAHAFLNACRHRGVPIASGCGTAKAFSCPYHGWTFSNDGKLTSVPNRQCFDEDQLHDLIALPLVEKIGLVLVHPDPKGTLDFDAFFGPILEHLTEQRYEELRFIKEYRAHVRINWKHAVDGGLEGYHVPMLHPETVGPFFLKQWLHLDFGLHHALVGPRKDILKLKDIPEDQWPEQLPFGTTNAIFPNTIVGSGGAAGPSGGGVFQRSEPGANPGECLYVFRTYGVGKNPEPEMEKIQNMMSDILMKTATQEDMKVQSDSQITMETGIVPTLVFGRREWNLIRMHKNHDRLLGIDPDGEAAKMAAE